MKRAAVLASLALLLLVSVSCGTLGHAKTLPELSQIATPDQAEKAFFFGVHEVKTAMDAVQSAHRLGSIPDAAYQSLAADESIFKKSSKVLYDAIQLWRTKGDPSQFIAAYKDFSSLYLSLTGSGGKP